VPIRPRSGSTSRTSGGPQGEIAKRGGRDESSGTRRASRVARQVDEVVAAKVEWPQLEVPTVRSGRTEHGLRMNSAQNLAYTMGEQKKASRSGLQSYLRWVVSRLGVWKQYRHASSRRWSFIRDILLQSSEHHNTDSIHRLRNLQLNEQWPIARECFLCVMFFHVRSRIRNRHIGGSR
jgi:hypothetical protein